MMDSLKNSNGIKNLEFIDSKTSYYLKKYAIFLELVLQADNN